MLIIYSDEGMKEPTRVYRDAIRKDCRVSYAVTQYILGKDPPNYPMPAPWSIRRYLHDGYPLKW